MSNLVKIKDNVHFSQNFQKDFNVEFGQNCRKISILVEIYENLNFGQNFWKILILINIFGTSRFGQYLGKSRFG